MTSVLKVDNIQNSSGTSAIALDSNGVVTRPVVPAWRLTAIHDDRTTTVGAYAQWNSATDGASAHNRRFLLGGCTLASNGLRVTVPVTGLYQVQANIRVDEIGSGYVYCTINVNDSTVSDTYAIEGTASTTYQTMTLTDVLYIRANDTVSIYVKSQSDSSWEVDANSSFSGVLIG